MTMQVVTGHPATITLKFTDSTGAIQSPPATGTVTSSAPSVATAVLGADMKTVTVTGLSAGLTVISYAGPSALAATESVTVSTNFASKVAFDETTIVAS